MVASSVVSRSVIQALFDPPGSAEAVLADHDRLGGGNARDELLALPAPGRCRHEAPNLNRGAAAAAEVARRLGEAPGVHVRAAPHEPVEDRVGGEQEEGEAGRERGGRKR